MKVIVQKIDITICFCRFEEERLKMKFNSNSNPIFKQATTTIQNPMFSKEAYQWWKKMPFSFHKKLPKNYLNLI